MALHGPSRRQWYLQEHSSQVVLGAKCRHLRPSPDPALAWRLLRAALGLRGLRAVCKEGNRRQVKALPGRLQRGTLRTKSSLPRGHHLERRAAPRGPPALLRPTRSRASKQVLGLQPVANASVGSGETERP